MHRRRARSRSGYPVSSRPQHRSPSARRWWLPRRRRAMPSAPRGGSSPSCRTNWAARFCTTPVTAREADPMRALILVIALLLSSTAVYAGRECVEKPLGPEAVRKGLRLAAQVREQLDRSDARIALVGRVGSDLSRHGLRYSHAGLIQRDHPAGRWIVVHALNACGTTGSALFEEGLGNFFFDDPFLYEAIVVVPSARLQQRLLDGLA